MSFRNRSTASAPTGHADRAAHTDRARRGVGRVRRTVVLDAPAQAPDDLRTVFSGWVTGGASQPVTLQLLDGDHWRDIASAGTDATGHYAIAVRLDQATDTRWRVSAPATPALDPGTSPALLIRPAGS
jgi:hypothetical protein